MVDSLVQTCSGWIQLDAKVPRGVPSTLKPGHMWLCVPSSSVFCRHYDCFFRNINVGIDNTSLPDSTVLTLSFLPWFLHWLLHWAFLLGSYSPDSIVLLKRITSQDTPTHFPILYSSFGEVIPKEGAHTAGFMRIAQKIILSKSHKSERPQLIFTYKLKDISLETKNSSHCSNFPVLSKCTLLRFNKWTLQAVPTGASLAKERCLGSLYVYTYVL